MLPVQTNAEYMEVIMDIIKVILTSILSVAALFIITKIMGHKQVSQLDFFDYISGITIGSVGAELATDLEEPWKPLTALIIYGAISLLISMLTNKFPRTRKYINGTPSILMNDGKLYRKNLKKAKLDLSEFMLLCREQGYFDLNEIQAVVFEYNGKLSILPKAAYRPITPTDMKITAEATHFGTEIIMDGRVMSENLRRLGKDGSWLEYQLTLQGYKDPRQIFLGVYHSDNDTLYLYPTV